MKVCDRRILCGVADGIEMDRVNGGILVWKRNFEGHGGIVGFT